MNREDAKKRLARAKVTTLSEGERASLLLDWWSIDESEYGYDDFPEPLKAALRQLEEVDDASKPLYNPLLELALRDAYFGVRNSYLESELEALGERCEVVGVIEWMATCPCCLYRSLRRSRQYEVCPVCFWEDDGTNEPNAFSAPNHITLRLAIDNFKAFGAVARQFVENVVADPSRKYIGPDP